MPGRLTLAIEISNPSLPQPGVAVGEVVGAGVQLIGAEDVRPSTRQEDDLVPAIDRLFQATHLSARDIGIAAVSVGPGGYTSMRMAVAAGKMIAEVAGARCIAVPSAMVAAIEARSGGAQGALAVVLASKGETAFVTLFPDGSPPTESAIGQVLTADKLQTLGASTLIADEHLPDAFRAAASNLGITLLAPHLTAASCLRASANLPSIDPAALAPMYARQPEAVTLWQARRAGR
jgi:tRNA threonylcarbamoyladenosine biosynthesis protein TsaB